MKRATSLLAAVAIVTLASAGLTTAGLAQSDDFFAYHLGSYIDPSAAQKGPAGPRSINQAPKTDRSSTKSHAIPLAGRTYSGPRALTGIDNTEAITKEHDRR